MSDEELKLLKKQWKEQENLKPTTFYSEDYVEELQERIEKVNNYVQEQKQEIKRLNNKLELISTIVEREFPPNEFITYKIKKILKGVDKE